MVRMLSMHTAGRRAPIPSPAAPQALQILWKAQGAVSRRFRTVVVWGKEVPGQAWSLGNGWERVWVPPGPGTQPSLPPPPHARQ